MWIREDLKDAIKQIFSIGDFKYECTENMYDEDLLILSDGNKKKLKYMFTFLQIWYIIKKTKEFNKKRKVI